MLRLKAIDLCGAWRELDIWVSRLRTSSDVVYMDPSVGCSWDGAKMDCRFLCSLLYSSNLK